MWIGRPVEKPGTRPLQVEIGDDFGSALAEWPSEHVVKVLCFYRPDDPGELRADQESTIKRLAQAARANELDFLLEVVPSKFGLVDQTVTAEIVERFYEIGVFPDWWKLEPMVSDEAWQNVCDVIAANDPHSRGVLVLGLDTSFDELRASFDVAAKHDLVKGFAVGRTIFADVADDWMSGDISDETGCRADGWESRRTMRSLGEGAGRAKTRIVGLRSTGIEFVHREHAQPPSASPVQSSRLIQSSIPSAAPRFGAASSGVGAWPSRTRGKRAMPARGLDMAGAGLPFSPSIAMRVSHRRP